MADHRLTWVDAFTDRRFGGNPCAVVFDAEDVDVATRIALTRETRLSECAFLVDSTVADFGARYYVASGEIPMAGHPTIATVAALLDAGMVEATDGAASFTLEVGAGVLPIEVDTTGDGPARITMQQLRPTFGREWAPDLVAPLLGLDPVDFRATPRTVSTGTPFLVTPLVSHEALRRAVLDEDALLAFHDQHDTDFFEPFPTAMGGATDDGDVFSRLLLTHPEPPEDPFTGSATGCLGAWLWANGELDDPRFVAEQGHDMGRPGRAEVEVLGPPDDISGVRVTGSGVVLLRGRVDLDDSTGGTGGGTDPRPARRPIAGLATGVTAFIGETEKNLRAGPTPVTSMREFTATFGDGPGPGELHHAVGSFFDNGGRRAVVVPARPTRDDHAAARAGLAADTVDLLVLPPPEVGGDVTPDLVEDARAWAGDRRVLLVLDPPSDWTDARLAAAAARPDDPNVAVYWPRVRVGSDPGGSTRSVAGAVAGVMARTDRAHGVWKAPAGLDAGLRGVVDLAVEVSGADRDLLNPVGVNTLLDHPRTGPVVWGARTSSTDPEWRYVPVRRTALWIESSLRSGLDWVVFEPNDEPLWTAVRADVEAFLDGVFRSGGLAGNRPAEAWFVRCDRTTMTAADQAAGRLVVLVGFAPQAPAEFTILRLALETRSA